MIAASLRSRGGYTLAVALGVLLFCPGQCRAQATSHEPPGQTAPPTDDGQGGTADTTTSRFVANLFGDVFWKAEGPAGEPNTFRLGQLDGFFNAQLSDRVSLLTEVVVELDEDGEFFVDLERLYVGFSLADWFNARAGRYHTSVGYYNTAFHHGRYFETAATRPLLFAFEDEGGPLPVHDVGASVMGRIPSGTLGLHYLFEIGNGQQWTEDEPSPRPSAVDRNASKSTNVGFSIVPDRWPGLEVGASFYRDRIAGPDDAYVDSRFVSAHAVYVRPDIEVLAECVWMRQAWPDSPAVHNTACYAQASKRIFRIRPYVRYEHTKLKPGTPLIAALEPSVGPVVGVRFDPAAHVAIKAQAARLYDINPDPLNRFIVQVAFAF